MFGSSSTHARRPPARLAYVLVSFFSTYANTAYFMRQRHGSKPFEKGPKWSTRALKIGPIFTDAKSIRIYESELARL